MPQQTSIPAPPAAPAAPTVVVGGAIAGSPATALRALRAKRSELREQLDRLQDQRHDLSESLQNPTLNNADRKGLEQRMVDVDSRIATLDNQIAATDAEVARAAGVPGAVVDPPRVVRSGPPEEAYVLGGIFMFVVLLPISLAYARRIWRRSSIAVAALPHEVMERLARLDQGMDAIAVEVERIGEGQRFMTRVLSEAPAAKVQAGERAPASPRA